MKESEYIIRQVWPIFRENQNPALKISALDCYLNLFQ
jgi:hypothetical protein